MLLFVKLALRNLTRNVRRTTITVLAVAFGLTMIHLAITMATGQYVEMIRVGVSTLAGHVVVQADGYQKKQDSDLVVERASEVGAAIAARYPEVVVAPRLALGGLLVSPTSSVGVGLMGLDAAAEAKVQEVDDKVVEGAWLDGDARGIVIGRKLADTLGLGLGDKVVYMGQHGGATEVQSRLFRVKGIFVTGSTELDAFVAFAALPAAQEVFGRPDVANRVTVHLANPQDTEAVKAELAGLLAARPELDVLNWREALPEIWAMIQLDKTSNDFIMAIIGLIVAMGVLNTVLMSVLERAREFGVMVAVGLKPERLAGLILLEGVFIGVIGAALGLVLGIAVSWPLVEYGIDYSEYVGGPTLESGGVAISAVIQGRFDPWRMAQYTGAAVIFTTLAALYPALFVARLRPVDAMRHT